MKLALSVGILMCVLGPGPHPGVTVPWSTIIWLSPDAAPLEKICTPECQRMTLLKANTTGSNSNSGMLTDTTATCCEFLDQNTIWRGAWCDGGVSGSDGSM